MDKDTFVHEDMLKATGYTLLGKLPDPFLMNSGQRVSSASDWQRRREEIRTSALNLLYGPTPPDPEFLKVEAICDYRYSTTKAYRIHTGTEAHPLHFRLQIILPQEINGKCPVIVDGDQCFAYSEGYLEAALSKGIAWALFDRTELAHDVQSETRGQGAIYETWPDLGCGALACWAWGYSRCVDALHQLDLPLDLDWIAFTGHSRGGKTALLAGAMDERARIVNPNESGAGGCGCYRLRVSGVYDNVQEGRSEAIRDSLDAFPYWYSRAIEPYVDNEAALPFDLHFVKAMIAPRTLFVSEAAGDLWANPFGSWQTTMAAQEVYRFLRAEENLFWYYRPGFHAHTALDANMLVNVIRHQRNGEPIDEKMFRLPFHKPELVFDWRCPTEAELHL